MLEEVASTLGWGPLVRRNNSWKMILHTLGEGKFWKYQVAAAEPEFFPCQGSPHTCLSSPGFKSESDVAPITWDLGYPHATYFFWNIWHWGAPAVQHRRQWNELIPPGFQKFSRSLGKSVHVLEDMCGWVFGLQNRGEDGFGVAVRRIGAPSRASWIRHPTWSWTKGRLETERPDLPTRYTHY